MTDYKAEYLKMEQSALLLIAAHDDLKEEITQLRTRIKELEAENNQLKLEIRSIKNTARSKLEGKK